ncbi:MAG: hypothetical protein DRR42_24370 [Gammaproteobacteria bacterium]|nr:MAG: hypothetical protein DRR42_24370 [Gammaproteobacteria bacterium]
MTKKIILSSICLLVLYLLAYSLLLQNPGWFFEQCTDESCYQKITVKNTSFYKTPYNSVVINESSGLITSRTHSGIIWTHSDSGNFPFIYAIDQYGNLKGASYVADSWPLDWEDIATDNQGNLYLLDYARIRGEQVIHVVSEPDPLGFSVSLTSNKIHFILPDMPKDDPSFKAESLFWVNEKLYLLTKDSQHKLTKLYRFPKARPGSTVTLEFITNLDLSRETVEVGGRVTAADISPDGKVLAVLTYWAVYFFQQTGDDKKSFSKPFGSISTKGYTEQAEGLTWFGNDLLISNEEGSLNLFKNVRPLQATSRLGWVAPLNTHSDSHSDSDVKSK